MSSKPTVLKTALERLIEEGYEAEVREQHLLVHAVPYVASDRTVRRGSLICTYVESAGEILPPDNHQVWFSGDFPCFADGRQIQQISNSSTRRELFKNCWVDHYFSNKPEGLSNFSDHVSKMLHYITLISDQARVLESNVDARTRRVIAPQEENSVFKYADTASVRAGITMLSERLSLARIAIIGLGGTGSFILDQIAKTPVKEIHLFDGDTFKQHNAFRSPGVASIEELRARLPKTRYFKLRYDTMREGIFSHEYFIENDNLSALSGFNFVFVCVDKGPARKLICGHLVAMGTPFIDVGMGVELVPETEKLIATCRYTLCTPSKHDHFDRLVPVMDDDDEALYGQNIQVADMNAMNAILAVMKWKQFFGFYHDDFRSHHGEFAVNTQTLTRKELCLEPTL